MEQDLIALISKVSIPGAIVAVVYIIFKPIMPIIADWIRSAISKSPSTTNKNGEVVTLATLDHHVKNLGTNHLHELKESLLRIEYAVSRGFEVSNGKLDEMRSDISFLKGRITNKN